MHHLDDLLLSALRSAPRRYRMPPLPADAQQARSAGADAALAFAIEAARRAARRGEAPPDDAQDLFTWGLAQLIREALAPAGGDPAFRALLLRAREAEVDEHVRLSAQRAADSRAVRAAVDAIAHPGKLRLRPAGALRDALEPLHEQAASGAWATLRLAVEGLLAQRATRDAGLEDPLQAVLAHPALQRLQRGEQLLGLPSVQEYRAFCEQRGPLAGSGAAAAQGRASARVGNDAERLTLEALRGIAALLDERAGGVVRYRAVRSLRTPGGFPGDGAKAKDEWDGAILRAEGAAAAVVLLAEVKAAPAAATPDLPRLRRGLQRLAQASATDTYDFASADGKVRVLGASLRKLAPDGGALPPHVIYCCSAPPEAQPQWLSAASKGVLSAEPASLAFAHELARGGAPAHGQLAPVWKALTTSPRLRATLEQYETSSAAREAMLHPQDLLQAVRHALAA